MDIKYYLQYWISGLWKTNNIITNKAVSIYEIDFDQLKANGIRLVVFDIDDTVAEHRGNIPTRTKELFQQLQTQGFTVAAFSNCSTKRTQELNELLKPIVIFNLNRSDKPNPLGFLEICQHFNIDKSAAAMVGEKMATDMYGSYLAGFKVRILVKPYTDIFSGKKAPLIARWERRLENILVD